MTVPGCSQFPSVQLAFSSPVGIRGGVFPLVPDVVLEGGCCDAAFPEGGRDRDRS